MARYYRILGRALVFYFLCICGLVVLQRAWGDEGSFRVGAGKADITGPAAELGMMGYADLAQTTAGIHSRLHSRAFVLEEALGPGAASAPRRVVYVSADLAFITQAVKIEVVDRLAKIYPGVYSQENVLLTATHTHSGPGGFSHYTLYNLTILGFSGENFEVIVSGIVRSIVQAHQSLAPAELHLNSARAEGLTVNRSLKAYLANPMGPLDPDTTPKEMTQIKAIASGGRELGLINFFAIHGTSLSKHNRLISSDNKGYAASLFERARSGFVAAFGNSEEGDSSPNIYDRDWNRLYDDLESVRVSGEAQYELSRKLYESTAEKMAGGVDYRHAWVRMPGLVVRDEFTGRGNQRLCLAGLGYSFAAGAEDGRSDVPGFKEGMRQGEINPITNPIATLLGLTGIVLVPPNAEDDQCQFPKPVFAATGRQSPVWTPDVLPFQIVRVGPLAIVGVPGEMTTMAGRILRARVLERLWPIGVRSVVIGGLANTYSDYITTREEYELQQYEGASTLFGPYTHAAYLQIFTELADSLRTGTGGGGQALARTSAPSFNLRSGVVYDDKRLWEKFGQVLSKPYSWYSVGQEVFASFRTGHPANDLRTEGSFARLERLEASGAWVSVLTDDDPELLYAWKRPLAPDCLACSDAEVRWQIPDTALPGTYRIVHEGNWKSGWDGKIRSLRGVTQAFEVR